LLFTAFVFFRSELKNAAPDVEFTTN